MSIAIVSPTAHPAKASWPFTPIDRFASRWLIQGTWIFDKRIDVSALKRGLVDAYPIVCPRLDSDVDGRRRAPERS